MSKAEEIGKTYALHKASEKLHDYYGHAMLSVVQFDGRAIENAYRDGYHQAEKDLELTWENVKEIYCIALNLREHVGSSVFGQPFYEEVLKQFKDFKERKQQ